MKITSSDFYREMRAENIGSIFLFTFFIGE